MILEGIYRQIAAKSSLVHFALMFAFLVIKITFSVVMSSWCRGVVFITTAQLHSTKPELRFCASPNSDRGVSEIRDGENL